MNEEQILKSFDTGFKQCTTLQSLMEAVAADNRWSGPDHERLRSDIEQMMPMLDSLRRGLRSPVFKIAMVGGFSGGKSTLVNEIFGRQLLSEDVSPETANVTAIRRAKSPADEKVVIHFLDREEFNECIGSFCKILQLEYRDDVTGLLGIVDAELTELAQSTTPSERQEQLSEFSKLLRSYERNKERLGQQEQGDLSPEVLKRWTTKAEADTAQLLPLVREVEIQVHTEVLTDHTVLVDLPGTDSTRPRDTKIAEDYLQGVDAIIVTTLFKRPFSKADYGVIELLNRAKMQIHDKVFFAISQFDLAKGAEYQKVPQTFQTVLEKIDSHFKISSPNVFLTSAWISRFLRKEPAGDQLTDEEKQDLNTFRTNAQEFMGGNGPSGDPRLKEALENYYRDGGVGALRDLLFQYFRTKCLKIKLDDATEKLQRGHKILEDVVRPAYERMRGEQESVKTQAVLVGIDMADQCREYVSDHLFPELKDHDLSADRCLAEFKENVASKMSDAIDKVIDEYPLRRKLVGDKNRAPLLVAQYIGEEIEQIYFEYLDAFISNCVEEPIRRCLTADEVEVTRAGQKERFSVDSVVGTLFRDGSEPSADYNRGKVEYLSTTKICLRARASEEMEKSRSNVPQFPQTGGPILDDALDRFKADLKQVYKQRYNGLSENLGSRSRDYIIYCLDMFLGRLLEALRPQQYAAQSAEVLAIEKLLPGIISSADLEVLESYARNLDDIREALRTLGSD